MSLRIHALVTRVVARQSNVRLAVRLCVGRNKFVGWHGLPVRGTKFAQYNARATTRLSSPPAKKSVHAAMKLFVTVTPPIGVDGVDAPTHKSRDAFVKGGYPTKREEHGKCRGRRMLAVLVALPKNVTLLRSQHHDPRLEEARPRHPSRTLKSPRPWVGLLDPEPQEASESHVDNGRQDQSRAVNAGAHDPVGRAFVQDGPWQDDPDGQPRRESDTRCRAHSHANGLLPLASPAIGLDVKLLLLHFVRA